jgi:hypothetical protein
MYLEKTPLSGRITISQWSGCLVHQVTKEAHITPALLLFAARWQERWPC